MEEFSDYTVFTTKTSDGREVEMAVIDEFEFEKKYYVSAALVEGDTINSEGLYIYRARIENGEFRAEKIHSAVDYKRVCDAYAEYTGQDKDDDVNGSETADPTD